MLGRWCFAGKLGRKRERAMPWEYRQVVHQLANDLDSFAADDDQMTRGAAVGWELVTALPIQRYGQTVVVVYIYKRPLAEGVHRRNASPIDLPLICRRDRKNVGTLTIIRANHPALTDAHGARLGR
jgi:hypothetical protein